MEENKYLILARQARAEDNSEDAKNYYNKVREENPDNGEAKFFYAYYSLYEGKVVELPQRFGKVCQAVTSAIKMVKGSDASADDKYTLIGDIVAAFIPMPWALNRFMNTKNRETKIGDSYVKVFDTSEIISVCKNGMFCVRDLGDELAKLFAGDAKGMEIAVAAWKEYVSLAQNWYAYPPKGEAEQYAEKIKAIDPSYEMPKKAGCISFADTKN